MMECPMNSRSAKLENWTVQIRYPLYPGYTFDARFPSTAFPFPSLPL